MYIWKQIDPAIERRISKLSYGWLSTPYMKGSQAKGVGVDCIHLITALLDELYNQPYTKIPIVSGQLSFNKPEEVEKIAKLLRTTYSSFIVKDKEIEPGDVLVFRCIEKGPIAKGHVAMALPTPSLLVHVYTTTVKYVSINMMKVVKIYRSKDKDLWKSQ